MKAQKTFIVISETIFMHFLHGHAGPSAAFSKDCPLALNV
jgi:hypothetical protein